MLLKALAGAVVLAGSLSSTAHARWREASSEHFVIYSEESADSLRKFAEKLELFDGAMRHIRGLPDADPGPANRLTVYVVRNVNTVQKLMGGKEKWVAGFYIPRATGSIAIVPRRLSGGGSGDEDENGDRVLLHEYGHHFMFQNYPGAYPAWFAEGFAEFHSTARLERDGGVGIGLPAMHRAYGLLSGNPLPVDELVATEHEKLTDLQREAIYGRGWLLTHYLTFDKERAGQLSAYLKAVNEGKSGLEAATAAFGDLKLLSKKLDRYLQQSRMPYVKVSSDALKVAPIKIREVSAGEDAVMETKIRSRRGVNPQQASALLPEMQEAAAPYPNDPAVQAALAEAEYDAANYEEAEAAADRALAVSPQFIDALIYKARAKMRLAEAKSDAQAWKDARRWIAAANKADPDDPEPLILFYDSFERQGIEPNRNAIEGLIYAYRLAPHDMGLRLRAARQLLIDGKIKDAEVALAPVAYSPHEGSISEAARRVLAALERGSAADALRAWGNSDVEDAEGGS